MCREDLPAPYNAIESASYGAAPAPVGKLRAARLRLAFGLALVCNPPETVEGERACSPACACLGADLISRIVRMLRIVKPLTDATISIAVAEFKAESVKFDGPRAISKWGRVAEWDVSQVVSMRELFRDCLSFNQP